jgi:hypothetical protein
MFLEWSFTTSSCLFSFSLRLTSPTYGLPKVLFSHVTVSPLSEGHRATLVGHRLHLGGYCASPCGSLFRHKKNRSINSLATIDRYFCRRQSDHGLRLEIVY